MSNWLSVDPLLFNLYLNGTPAGGVFNTKNLSGYSYAANNPIKYVDPSGLFVIDPQATPEQRLIIQAAIDDMRSRISDPVLLASVLDKGQLTESQLKSDFVDGNGPVIKIANLNNAYGEFSPGINSNELRVDKNFIDGIGSLSVMMDGEKKKDLIFLLGVTILHEDVHRGDDQNGVDYPGEEGSKMEIEVFDMVVGESNMGVARAKNDIKNAKFIGPLQAPTPQQP